MLLTSITIATFLMICCSDMLAETFSGKINVLIATTILAIILEIVGVQFAEQPKKDIDEDNEPDINVLKKKYWKSISFLIIKYLFIINSFVLLMSIVVCVVNINEHNYVLWVVLSSFFQLFLDVVIYKNTCKNISKENAIKNVLAFEVNCLSVVVITIGILTLVIPVIKLTTIIIALILVLILGFELF